MNQENWHKVRRQIDSGHSNDKMDHPDPSVAALARMRRQAPSPHHLLLLHGKRRSNLGMSPPDNHRRCWRFVWGG
jgi:hypothetical protein